MVVAAKPLRAMTVVKPEAVTVKTLKEADLPEGCFSSAAQVIGKVLAMPMVKEQTFTKACFVSEGSGSQLAAVLPDGKRAVSVSLQDHCGLEPLLYPGSMVDVLVSMQLPSSKEQAVSTTLLKGLEVLAVGRRTVVSPDEEEGDDAARRARKRLIVTLLTDSQQAQILLLATEHGSVSLALRNPTDATAVAVQPTLLTDLTGDYGTAYPDLESEYVAILTQLASQRATEDATASSAAQPQTPQTPPATQARRVRKPHWRTEVIRGLVSRTVTFPMPSGQTQEDKGEPEQD